jgi:beta-lactamase class A
MRTRSRSRAARPARARVPSLARSENSLYLSIQAIKRKHQLERLGVALYDSETRMQWSYNGDAYFHAASTMKLAVLAGVFRQVFRKELELEAPVHVRNRFKSLIDDETFTLDLDRDASAEVAARLGKTMSVKELAYKRITTSSNLATNLLIDVVGVSVIQKALDELRVDGIELLRGVDDQKAFAAGKNNMATADSSPTGASTRRRSPPSSSRSSSTSGTRAGSRPGCPATPRWPTRRATSPPCTTMRESSISARDAPTRW